MSELLSYWKSGTECVLSWGSLLLRYGAAVGDGRVALPRDLRGGLRAISDTCHSFFSTCAMVFDVKIQVILVV